MSFKRISLAVLAALVLVAMTISTSGKALPSEPPEVPEGFVPFRTCVSDDVYYHADEAVPWLTAGTKGWWVTTEAFWTQLVNNPNNAWYWPGETMGPCVVTSPAEMDVSFGDELDLWYGACGMYFPQSPFSGLASLYATAAPEGVTPLRGACGLSVTDADNHLISNPAAGLYYYYYSLDQFLYDKWVAEDLGLFVYNSSSGMWNECSSFLIDLDLDNGEYGRVACIANYLGTFVVAEK